jgi:hypothetical protein
MKLRLLSFRILAILVALILALGAAELFFRQARPDLVPSNHLRMIPDPYIGWRFMPLQVNQGYSETGEARTVRTNSLGFVDEEHSLAAQPGTRRIAFLGDSFTAAVGVDQKSNMVSICQQRLAAQSAHRVECLNFGVPSFGTKNQWLTWRHYAAPFRPELVVVNFFLGNDVANQLPDYPLHGMNAPRISLKGDQLEVLPFEARLEEGVSHRHRGWLYRTFLEPSLIYQQLKLFSRDTRRRFGLDRERQLSPEEASLPFWKRSHAPIDWQTYLKKPGEEFEKAWEFTFQLIRQLKKDVEVAGARIFFVLIPGLESLDPDRFRESFKRYPGIEAFEFDLEWPRIRMVEFLQFEGISFLDFAALMRDLGEGESPLGYYFEFDRHLAPDGHQLLGEAIADRLKGMLESSQDR